MRSLLIATNNPDKFREISALLSDLPFHLFKMEDFPQLSAVEEDRATIEGNAAKKALETARAADLLCLADDTGLFIDALGGEPGVFAARWAGEGCTYRDNRLKALRQMSGVSDRAASFRTVVALAAPDGIIGCEEGRGQGIITTQERGQRGFGYDAVFEVNGTGLTYAEMSDSDKNTLSHRALAILAIRPLLERILSLR